MKIGFLFPGQGAQTIGMGKDLYEEYEEIKKVYSNVKEITGVDVAKISFEGPEDILNQTKNTQLCILTMSLAITEVLKKYNIKPDASCGLSLGEYSALITSNALEFNEGVKLVQKRGEYMQLLSPEGQWLMAAILGMDEKQVEEVCSKVTKGFVVPANYNTTGQIVISGEKDAVEEAGEIAKQLGAKKVSILNTAGPFHTEKLTKAANALKNELQQVNFHDFETNVIKNIDGTIYTKEDDMVEILSNHVTHPVRFSKSLYTMLEMGIDTFVEIGPGRTLSSFVKRLQTDKQVTILNINNIETLKNVVELLKN